MVYPVAGVALVVVTVTGLVPCTTVIVVSTVPVAVLVTVQVVMLAVISTGGPPETVAATV